jgi:chromosome segregation ATPase
MFGNKTKVESFAALKDKPAQDITAEEIAAVNTELSAIGLSGVEVSVAGALETANNNVANLTKELETANADLAAVSESLNGANASVEQLTADLAAANARIAELSGAAATDKKEPIVNGDAITSSNEDDLDAQITARLKEEHGL